MQCYVPPEKSIFAFFLVLTYLWPPPDVATRTYMYAADYIHVINMDVCLDCGSVVLFADINGDFQKTYVY